MIGNPNVDVYTKTRNHRKTLRKTQKQQLTGNQRILYPVFLHWAWTGRFARLPRSLSRHYPQHLFSKNATTTFRPENGFRIWDAL